MRSLLTILLLSISLAAATPVLANDGTAQDRLLLAQGGGKSLNEAVEQVRRQYKGRIVSAETRRSGNRDVHHIKVLTEDGKVKTVKVNGKTHGNG